MQTPHKDSGKLIHIAWQDSKVETLSIFSTLGDFFQNMNNISVLCINIALNE